MSVNIMQFKSRIRNLAQEEGVPAQVMLQNFMFERFFARLCKSTVRENLILKGGALISQYLGISRRTTMDIDLTMSNAPLTESTVSEMIQGVFSVRLDDGVRWLLNVLEPIRLPRGGFSSFRPSRSPSAASTPVPPPSAIAASSTTPTNF